MNDKMIYVHFPFCKRKCAYCDFYSVTDLSLSEKYIERLCKDISLFGEKFPDTEISSVYIGGGTPSIMKPENAEKLFSALHRNFKTKSDAEISFELNPESASKEILKSLSDCGVNRISMGIQSLFDDELSLIGRIHNAAEAEKAVNNIRESEIDNFNLDLIYALPGQSLARWKKSLERLVLFEPEHISFYALSLSENVPLYSRINELPDDNIQREMYLYAVNFLESKGYYQYEISNAAKPGFESRHNIGYWMGKEYIGFGAGAHSYLNKKRFSVLPDISSFISNENRDDILIFDTDDSLDSEYTEYLFLSLRTKFGLDLGYIEEHFGKGKKELCEKILSDISKHSLSLKTEKGYRLTPEGFFVSDSIITKLL